MKFNIHDQARTQGTGTEEGFCPYAQIRRTLGVKPPKNVNRPRKTEHSEKILLGYA